MKSGRSIFKLSRSQWISAAVLASSLGLAAAVTIPFPTFTAGTPASASQVSGNFTALVGALTAAEAALTTAQGQITTLDTAVTAANAQIASIQARQPAVKAFQTTSSVLFPAAEGDLRTFSVTTPGAGQLMITMSGWFRMTHANGTATSLSLFVRHGAVKYRAITDAVIAAAPSGNTVHTFAFTAAFPVAAAGVQNIIVSGLSNVAADWGDCGPVVQGCPIVTLLYVPGTLP